MNQKLFVGSLPFSSTEDGLKDFFSQAGEVVEVKIITDRYTGKSRGFGFVEMKSEEEAKKAIEMFDGQDYEGRKIKVDVAKPQPEKSFRN